MGYGLFCGSSVTLKCEWLQQTLFEAKESDERYFNSNMWHFLPWEH